MQDQRIAALEEQMANKELQHQQEKEKILKALKAERACKKEAVAKLNAMEKELKSINNINHGTSPTDEVQKQENLPTPSTQQQYLIKQIVELAINNTALKNLINTNELKWEEEKGKIIGALRKERAYRKEEKAEKRKLVDNYNALKHEVDLFKLMTAQLSAKDDKVQEMQVQIKLHTQQTVDLQEEMTRQLSAKDDKVQQLEVQIELLTQQTADLQEEMTRQISAKDDQVQEREVQIELLTQQTVNLQEAMTGQISAKDDQVQEREVEIKLLTKQTVDLQEEMTRQLSAKDDQVQEREVEIKLLTKQTVDLQEEMTGQLSAKAEQVSRLEEKFKLLKQEHTDLQVANLHLQELSQKTDKEKAKIKKEAEQQLKKEKKEAEKKQKELQKAQKKEKAEKLKNDIKELTKPAKERKFRVQSSETSTADEWRESTKSVFCPPPLVLPHHLFSHHYLLPLRK
ncbi:early endosome antigen 1-like [Clinocottus analis]|uniref:early endosome antigen 1-like n=1 Tax=Clinocottus analis TaxID=304258 RepID=UPI0035C0DF92